jgi:hypothetical protein
MRLTEMFSLRYRLRITNLKKFRDNLKAQTPFVACSERLDLPTKSGNQYEMFMYVPFAPNTAQTAEGTVGSSISISVLNTVATIGRQQLAA